MAWWEEPFSTGALREYSRLAARTSIPLAGGEGSHTADQARHFIDYGSVGYVQVDAGRIGGITAAREVAQYARDRAVRYVNHTFTSNLALSASLQPFADAPEGAFTETPVDPSALAIAIAGVPWSLDAHGMICAPDGPGLGVTPDLQAVRPYLQRIEFRWNGRTLFESAEF